MLDEARAGLVEVGRSLRFEQVDVQDLPFADDTFDAVIANHMLYHVPDRSQALAEIHRVLKGGGTLYAATNGKPDGPTLVDWHVKAGVKVNPSMPTGRGGGRFSLESCGPELEQVFSRVELHRYEDALHISEVEPLVDYVQSGGSKLDADELHRFRIVVAAEIAERGFLHIVKAGGLFVAHNVEQKTIDSAWPMR
jgi:SAM-dependent methyltransferase